MKDESPPWVGSVSVCAIALSMLICVKLLQYYLCGYGICEPCENNDIGGSGGTAGGDCGGGDGGGGGGCGGE